MSSISVKPYKYSGVIIGLILPALPALVMPLFAVRWQPSLKAGEFPGAVFHSETVAASSIERRDIPPKIMTVPEGPRPGLPANSTPPEEIARAFYRAVRENAESIHGLGPPFHRENTESPDNIPGPAEEPAGTADGESAGGKDGTGGGTGRMEGAGWQLLGFIRDSAGVERRYFKEKESGKIVMIINVPDSFPDNEDSAKGGNR